MPVLTVRNLHSTKVVLSHPDKNILSVEWQPAGDPNGEDVQQVGDVFAQNTYFLRSVGLGILEILPEDEAAEAIIASAASGGTPAFWGSAPVLTWTRMRGDRPRLCAASARAAATSAASVNPLAGPSRATNSKGTFWATVIMTCWSLAFGPRLTSQTLLPGLFLARLAAS